MTQKIDPATVAVVTPDNADVMQSLGGLKLLELDPQMQSVVLQFTCRPEFCHSGNKIAQGGYITAWMDAAMAHAVILHDNHQHHVASLDVNVRFLERVGPGIVRATGRVVRRGKRIAFMEGTLHNEQGLLLATATSNAALVPVKK